MTYGVFLGDGSAFSITTADIPLPWSNTLFNDTYVAEVSQTGQGVSRCRTPKIRTIGRGYRFFYILDRESGHCWCPTARPLRTRLDSFECIHTLPESIYKARCHGIASEITVYVPLSGNYEIWRLAIRNVSRRMRRLSVFSVLSLQGGNYYLQETAIRDGMVCHRTVPYRTPYEANNQPARAEEILFVFPDRKPASCDCSESRFFGTDDFSALPAAVKRGRCSGGPAHMHGFAGAFQHTLTLKPGARSAFHIVAGYAGSVRDAVAVRRTVTRPGYFREEYAGLKRRWAEECAGYSVSTPDENLNRLLNHWLKKQCRFLARNDRMVSAAPVRNLLQDALGYALLNPAYASERILAYTAWQRSDGFLQQWRVLDGSDPKESHSQANYRDAPFWLVACVCHAANLTGDERLLDRVTGFCDSNETATVYEHLLRALYHLARDTGAHGLCLMGDGDWFDPLNGPGRLGRGESTWLTMAFRYAVQTMIPFCEQRGDARNLRRLREIDRRLYSAINQHCWDSNRYVAGFDDEGKPFGCRRDEEGRVYLNPQVWALISDSVPSERMKPLMATIESLQTPFGPHITYPAYTKWDSKVGRISLKRPGTTENGSVYCHGAMFEAYAYCLRKMGSRAYDILRRTLPTNPENPPEKNLQVPLFVPNFYFALPKTQDFGLSSRFYETGTCPWFIWVAIEHLLGVRATTRGLLIDPALPDEWEECGVSRKFREARYDIEYRRSNSTPGMRISVDGRTSEQALLPYEAGRRYAVNVELPRPTGPSAISD